MTEETRAQCRAAGMTDFLGKPVDADRLLQTLETVTADRAGAAAGPSPGAAPAAPEDAPAAGPGDKITDIQTHPDFFGDQEPVLNIEVLDTLAQLGDDTAFLGEVIADYRREARELLDELRQAFARGDLAATRDAAHALRSSSANVGARRVQRLASALNDAPADRLRRDGAQQLADLDAEFARFCDAVQRYLDNPASTTRLS